VDFGLYNLKVSAYNCLVKIVNNDSIVKSRGVMMGIFNGEENKLI
jgi:hypothetical protein